MPHARRSAPRLAAWLLIGVVASACRQSARDDRAAILATAEAQRVVGVWDVSLQTDPRLAAGAGETSRTVTGTLALTENRHGTLSTSELAGVTHQGVADLDLRPLGWSTGAEDSPQVSVARVAPRSPERGAAEGDSLVIVIGPGTSRFVVRLSGIVTGDDASGTWRVSAFSGGGGGGRFLMHRRR